GLSARRWPGTSSLEALVATGSGERAVIVGGAERSGPGGSAPPDIPGADAVLRRAGPSNRRLTPVRGRAYLSQRAAGRDWRVSAGALWQVHPGAGRPPAPAGRAPPPTRPGGRGPGPVLGARALRRAADPDGRG